MDAGRRARYLDALGIDAWVPRFRRGAAGVSAAAERAAATSADAERTAPMGAATVRSAEPQSAAADAGAGEVAHAWEALRAEVETCTKCPLHRTRTRAVFGVGDPRAQWLVVGEAPGAEEDRQGVPFVGRAGQLLDAMLLGIGLARGRNVYIANVLKSRPPNNRDPKPEEVASCLPYIERQIALIRPALILAVGRIAAHHLLGVTVSLGSLRGRVHYFGELNTPVIVTYHPAYLLRTPADKRKAWEDLKFARRVFRELTSAA